MKKKKKRKNREKKKQVERVRAVFLLEILISAHARYKVTYLRALDSFSLLGYVVTTQMQIDFRFSSTARYCLAAKFYFSYCFSVRMFFQSRKRVLQ